MQSTSYRYIAMGLVAGLAIGYFAGREHLKYEMRSAIQTAVGDFQHSLFGNTPAPAPAPAPKATEPSPVSVTLLKKGFKKGDIHAGDFEDDITLKIAVKNLATKDIRAIDGVLEVTDLLDNNIISIRWAINDPIKAGAVLDWNGGIQFNQFIDSHKRLLAASQENLKVSFVPKKVLFADGTTKEY